MLRRAPFRSKQPERRPCTQWDGPMPTARSVAIRVADTRAHLVVPIEKPVKARPGKRTPTKAETEWMDKIVAYGCIACRLDGFGQRPAAVHHMLRGGRRIGHLFTLPLCPDHHVDSGNGFIARHPFKARFEKRYGAEAFLLDLMQQAVRGSAR